MEVQKYAASTRVKDMKEITKNNTINSVDCDVMVSTETDIKKLDIHKCQLFVN